MCQFSRRVRYRPDYLVLETIAFSHIVEKVRWCLDRMGADYGEEQDVGILGAVAAQRPVREEKCRHQQRARSSVALQQQQQQKQKEQEQQQQKQKEQQQQQQKQKEQQQPIKQIMHNVHEDRITGTI